MDGDSRRDGPRGRTERPWSPAHAQGPAESVDQGSAGYRLGARIDPVGNVYEAQHPRFPGQLAIKLFPRAVGEGASAVAAFAREAGRVSILRHPRIAQVLDSGTLPDRTPFVAMERLFGRTLEDLLGRRGLLTISQAFTLLRDIVLGLSAAHEAGVVHREIRPDNVFLVDRADMDLGFVKLLDFGVSQLTWAAHAAGRGIGPDGAYYLAPEQVRRGLAGVDARTDQFALAVLTYRMLRGPDPFLGPSIARASAVDTVLGKALSDNSDQRFGSLGHFFRALEEAIISSVPTPPPMQTRWVSPRASASDNAITKEVVLSVAPLVDREGSLVQRFFEEGDRHEQERWRNAPLARGSHIDAPEIEFTSFDRVPTRRTPLAAVLVLAAIVGTVFVGPRLGWPLGWPSDWPSPRAVWDESRIGRTVYFFRAALPWRVQAPMGSIVPETRAPSAPPATARAASPLVPLTAPVPSVAAETAGAIGTPDPVRLAAPADADLAVEPQAPTAPSPSERSRSRRKLGSSSHHHGGSVLRGYVWSPVEQRLVPSAK